MRLLLFLCCSFTLALACQDPSAATRSEHVSEEHTPFVADSFSDSVALAHGYANWHEAKRVEFDFVVEVRDTARVNRSWAWYPHTDSMVLTVGDSSMSYRRSDLQGVAAQEADKQFINDSYWVFMPFYLVWSEAGFSGSLERQSIAPISGESLSKYTVVYATQGGYTPGDAYDLYIDADYHLREWVYRENGQLEPSMTMTWEGYRDLDGLYLPTRHTTEDAPLEILHPTVAMYQAGE